MGHFKLIGLAVVLIAVLGLSGCDSSNSNDDSIRNRPIVTPPNDTQPPEDNNTVPEDDNITIPDEPQEPEEVIDPVDIPVHPDYSIYPVENGAHALTNNGSELVYGAIDGIIYSLDVETGSSEYLYDLNTDIPNILIGGLAHVEGTQYLYGAAHNSTIRHLDVETGESYILTDGVFPDGIDIFSGMIYSITDNGSDVLTVFNVDGSKRGTISTGVNDMVAIAHSERYLYILAENSDVSLDYTELLSDIKYYRDNPLNLNSATADDLKKLIFLNNIQIYNILAYRENYGNFISVYELQGIDGLDNETILKILPYITIEPVKSSYKPTVGNIIKSLKNEVFIRYQRVLQEQAGYSSVSDASLYQNPNSYYLGSPDKVYVRYGLNYRNKVRFGLTMEKDAGEPFLKSKINDSIARLPGMKSPNGFDFYSVYISIAEFGHLKALTIGNYQLKFGQGLTMWTGLAFGKSSDATNIERFASGVRPYTSTDENGYLSGVVSTFRLGKFDITSFYSSNMIDAGISERDTMPDSENIASSIPETGYHRTPSEIRKKDALNLKAYGGNLTFRANRLKLGLTAFTTHLSYPFLKDHSAYNKFDFTGSQIFNAGVDFNYIMRKVNIYGEVSYSDNGSIAQLYGITAYPHNRIYISLLYRNFPKDYHNLFSNAFSESGHTFNEQGFYSGFNILLHKKWTLSAYIDNFRFPWLRYRINSPSTGNDNLVQLNYSPSRYVSMYFRFKQKNKQFK